MNDVERKVSDMKHVIVEASLRLLESKGIDKITVRDITTACGISRQTFYYHFRDVPHVYESILQKQFKELEEKCISVDHPRKALYLVLESGLQNRQLILRIQGMKNSDRMNGMAVSMTRDTIRAVLEKRRPDNLYLRKKDMDFVLEFYAHGVCGYMTQRLISGDYDVHELAERLYRVMEGELRLLNEDDSSV